MYYKSPQEKVINCVWKNLRGPHREGSIELSLNTLENICEERRDWIATLLQENSWKFSIQETVIGHFYVPGAV